MAMETDGGFELPSAHSVLFIVLFWRLSDLPVVGRSGLDECVRVSSQGIQSA